MKLLCWNVGGRIHRLPDQIRAVMRQDADIVCLQEVRESTLAGWRDALSGSGLSEIADSSCRGDRKLFNLTASHWPVTELDRLPLPQPERVLSARVRSDHGIVEVHNVHVPPSTNGAVHKYETLAAIHRALAVPSSAHRVVCGDLNTSGPEFEAGGVALSGRRVRAEGLLLRDLAEWDLCDVFRGLHGFGRSEVSWSRPGFHRMAGHRLDHVLASGSLRPVFCEYQHGWRQEGFSDHSALEAIFDPLSV